MLEYRRDAASIPAVEPVVTKHSSQRAVFLGTKRCFDILATLAIAPLAVPIIATAALLVRRDGGPAFYSQPRIGKGGATFRLWKLRTMRADAEIALETYFLQNPSARKEWLENQKLRHDPRVTTIGRLLRKYSIDELPQLLNVIKGEMSLVGPRPFMPEQRRYYPGTAYFSVRPGLTGLWQVSERNGCTFAERAAHDSRYAATMSFSTDFKIILRTVLVILYGTGL